MSTTVPSPSLDSRDGALVAAESIGALPNELSDRSDSNPAVAIIEASAAQFDKLIYQLNRWPSAVIQKALALVGVTIKDAASAVVSQTFTLSQPQPTDVVIPEGTQVANSDGSIVFATTEDLTISAYTTNLAGTISLSSGSAIVTGAGTAFVTDGTWNGYQIQGVGGAWYTISSVSNATTINLTATSTSTLAGVAYYVGAITGSVTAECTVAGSDGNAAANTLTTVQSAPGSVSSTNNSAAATGGTDDETTDDAIARAPTAFASRDVASTAEDYAYFAKQVLGPAGRAKALANTNITTSANGYVTVALLSPNWTTSSAVSSQERANVISDLSGRQAITTTTVDVPANIQSSFTPVCAVVRKLSLNDSATCQANIQTAFSNYFNPYIYTWGRSIYVADMIELAESVAEVDRVVTVNGVPAVGSTYSTSAATATITNGSTSVTGVGAADYAAATANQTFIVDTVTPGVYLITAKSGGNAFTLDRAWGGSTQATTYRYFKAADVALTNSYSLPYVVSTAVTALVTGAI